MLNLSMYERTKLYSDKFPNFPPLRVDNRWADGMWILGNNYTTSGYYGAYPYSYIERIMSMFPDAKNILHLFSGSINKGNYIRFDVKSEFSDVCGDANFLSTYFQDKKFDLILSDPPYSIEDCEHYGCSMINRDKVLNECWKILEDNGYIIWLDQVLPMFSKEKLRMVGVIGLVKSTNHRFRVVTIFRKQTDVIKDNNVLNREKKYTMSSVDKWI